jgi:hypothetical protein
MQRTSRVCATPCSGLHHRPEQQPRAKLEAGEMKRTTAEGEEGEAPSSTSSWSGVADGDDGGGVAGDGEVGSAW